LLFLVEILLPRAHESGDDFEAADFVTVQRELTAKFGGVTAFLRSSAQGLWQAADGEVVRDEIAVFEVMVEQIDEGWWTQYRRELERRFRQDQVVIRSIQIRQL